MTGKKVRPSTEPLYSEGNRKDFPITTGYDSAEYGDLIGSHITKYDENSLVCQSFSNGYFSGCFAPSKRHGPRPNVSWAIRNDYDSFFELVRENWKWTNGKSKQIHSLACDENSGFGVVFMENYGTGQFIVTNLTDIQKLREEGYHITSCAARGSNFYVIMTKDTEEYHGRNQSWSIWNTYGLYFAIPELSKTGHTITGICYSTGLRQYFVVVTNTPEIQSIYYLGYLTEVDKWMKEQCHVGYYPNVIFFDQNLDKFLAVMTRDISTCGSASFQCVLGLKLKEAQNRFHQGSISFSPHYNPWIWGYKDVSCKLGAIIIKKKFDCILYMTGYDSNGTMY